MATRRLTATPRTTRRGGRLWLLVDVMPGRVQHRVRAAQDQATRRQLRAVVGRLSHNLVQPRTLEVYQNA
eukprot:7118998-Pyramimonas_sp.AAC.1